MNEIAAAPKKRKDYVDVAKGIAMVWIIAVHADGAPYTGTVGYVLLIPLFFLTSGFLWKDKDEPVLRQLKQRVKPLLRPYFAYNAALFVFYLIDWFPTIADGKRAALRQVIKKCFGILYSEGVIWMNDTRQSLHFFTVYNYPLWFLTAMVTASAAFLFLLWLRRRFGWKLWYLVIPCLLITILLNHLPLRLPWNANNCFLAAALMAAGMGARQADIVERQWNRRWLEPFLWIAAAGFVLFCGIWNHAMSTSMLMSMFGPHGDWGVIIYFVGGVTGACLMLRVCRLFEHTKIGRMFQVIGKNTIPVLALHRTIITYYNRLWSHFIGAQPELYTPQYFVFSIPRLILAAGGSMGLLFLGRFLMKKFTALRRAKE